MSDQNDINSEDLNCGRIESLELKDFMCHRHLMMSFDYGINIITGTNGSGKSAIVAALQVYLSCLWFLDRFTGRLWSEILARERTIRVQLYSPRLGWRRSCDSDYV